VSAVRIAVKHRKFGNCLPVCARKNVNACWKWNLVRRFSRSRRCPLWPHWNNQSVKLQRNVGVLKAVLQYKVQVSHFAKTCLVILELLIPTDRQAGMTNVICAFFQPCVSGLPKICGLRETWTCCVVPSVTKKLTHEVAWISGSVSCSNFESLFTKLKLLRYGRCGKVHRFIPGQSGVRHCRRFVHPCNHTQFEALIFAVIRCRKTGRWNHYLSKHGRRR
jgi:hypothetical protein